MNILHGLETLLGAGARGAGQAVQGAERALGVGQPQGQGLPMSQGLGQAMQRPDFTYNPNPNSNIPNSSHNLQAVQLANGRLPLSALHQTGPQIPMGNGRPNFGTNTLDPTNAGRPMTGNFNPQQSQGNQFNPGFSPLQAQTSFGAGPHGVQPYGINPQITDSGPFWNGN